MRLFRSGLLFAALLLSASFAHGQLVHDVTQAEVSVAATSRAAEGAVLHSAFASSLAAHPYDGVALQGTTDSPRLEGWIRFGADGPWEPLYVVRSATGDAFLAAFRGRPEADRTPFALRFETDAPYGVVITAAGTFDSRLDAHEPVLPGSPGPSLRKTAPTLVPPHLHTRAEWGAEPFRGFPQPLAPQGYVRLTFHHAAGFGAYTRAEGLAQVRAIQAFHQNGRGWSDVGYQFLMDQSGRIYQGRPFLDAATTLREVPRLALGAHVGGANTGNIGVSVLGCYHPPEPSVPCQDRLSPAALDSLVTLLAFLSEAYDVPAAQLMGHRDQSQTACPGDNNYALIPEIEQAMLDLQARGNAPFPTPDGVALAPGAPHPIRDAATLRYYLPAEGFVSLTVYDATGRVVTRPVARTYQTDARWYEVPFAASGLAAGTYFARLHVEGFRGTTADVTEALVVVR